MKLKPSKIIQKIALILVCLLTLNFIAPIYISNADFGGVLASPFKSLFLALGDAAEWLLEFSLIGGDTDVIKNDVLNGDASSENVWTGKDKNVSLPLIRVTPEAIFSGKIRLLNINFIDKMVEKDDDIGREKDITAMNNLRKAIATWYTAIRNLALVVMLSTLVYTGIRIIISSASSEKAKYKQMLTDWVIGICLLFMLHYLMAFIVNFTEMINDMFSQSISDVKVWSKYPLEIKDDDIMDELDYMHNY